MLLLEVRQFFAASALIGAALLLAGCGQTDGGGVSAAAKPLSKQAMQLLGSKGLSPNAPIFVRIFKEESELEVWKARENGRFYHFKTYPICNWSGELGPKQFEGDKQAPEGFYTVSNNQLNPRSQFYLAFNLGFPNAYDRAHGRTGSALMVHGDCRSRGCYAMTDALIEEIYAVAREALAGGQKQFAVHAFPFRMTAENMKRHKASPWMPFWKSLKAGYDHFELSRQVPSVVVCNRSYLVNATFNEPVASIDPLAACPPYERRKPEVWVETTPDDPVVAKRVVAPGKKTRIGPATSVAVVAAPADAAVAANAAATGDAATEDAAWTNPDNFTLPKQ